MNDIEELVFKILKKEYGMTWEAVDEEIAQSKIDSCKKLYELAVNKYRVNQSASNYNNLITAMIALQYWNQKRTKMFSTTEDF